MEADVRNEDVQGDVQDEVTAGALDMDLGAHKTLVGKTMVGHKFYTVGRARYKPFKPPVREEPEFRDFKLGLPLAYDLALDVFTDAFRETIDFKKNEQLAEKILQDLRDKITAKWPQQVLAYLNAHSGLVGEKFSKAAAPGIFCFDVKLMLQEPVRTSTDLDVNKDMSRVDAINKLRVLRVALSRRLPNEFLKAVFRGWKRLPLNIDNNPYLDPFQDMTEEDFSPDPDVRINKRFFPEGLQLFVFNEDVDAESYILQPPQKENQEFAGGALFHAVHKDYSEKNPYVRMSSFGHAHSKFFDATSAILLAERSQVFENDNAFVFVQKSAATAWAYPDMPMYLFVAYGFNSSDGGFELVHHVMHELGANEAAVVVPSAMPAFGDGQQDCPERPGWIDLDISKFWVKHFHAKALTRLPRMSLDILRTSKHQKYSKYDAFYEAMRCNDTVGPVEVPHIECADTGVPHEFLLHIRM